MRTLLGLMIALGGMAGGAPAADFNGDGRDDVAVFRPATGMWAVRDFTVVYLGTAGDSPAPGDYDGDRADEIATFRPADGLWSIRDVSRFYFGSLGDVPLTGIGQSYAPSQFFVDPGNGFVGIGTAAPEERLDVHGAALADDYLIFSKRGEKASLVGMVEALQEEIKALKQEIADLKAQ